MSSLHLPRVVSQRGKSSLEIERENFEKRQITSIQKAINASENPVKEKHVRSIILGTFQDAGANMFWQLTGKLPLKGNPIVCWKFCHVLHKMLRDGHQNSILDSVKYLTHITDLGKLWGHLKEGYGKLILAYCTLLKQKLQFHRKYPRIPGNLLMLDEQFNKVCGAQVDNYFEFSVDMLDYLDEILNLQQAVYSSLDMSRANSMTTSGQCRLAPLILCILDSCQLYDYLVKSLFRLHSSLPPDTLSGHRERFLQGYKRLKQFYHSSHNLQYFKNLVQVPSLPDEPPNFLVASDFSKHVKPVAVVPDQDPEPEPEPEDIPDADLGATLVDTSVPDQAFGENGREGPDERDLLIERLQREIMQLREELQRVKFEDQRIIQSLKDEISKLEKILSELRISGEKYLKENDALKRELAEARVGGEAVVKLAEAEKQSKANFEKFQKMKDIYGKLREEHVQLLRTNAEATKQLQAEKKAVEEKEQIIKANESELKRMEHEKNVVQESLRQSADEVTQQLAQATSNNSQLEREKEELEMKLKSVESDRTGLSGDLESAKEQVNALQTELSAVQAAGAQREEDLTSQVSSLQKQLDDAKQHASDSEKTLGGKLDALQSQLEQTMSESKAREEGLQASLTQLQQQLSQSQADLQQTKSLMQQQLDDLHRRLIESSCREGKAIIEDAMEQSENPVHTTTRSTAEYLLLRAEPVVTSLGKLKSTHSVYTMEKKDLEEFVRSISDFSHHLSDCIIHGFATAHSAQIEPGEELTHACKKAGESAMALLDAIEKGGDVAALMEENGRDMEAVMKLAEALVPKSQDISAEELGDMVESEMVATSKAIEDAASKIAEMLEKARNESSGVDLEVNEGILDSCTELMKAIKVLVEKSRDLQKEIVSQGRGTSSAKEFYKKNHRWTEGLQSAAKTVGFGATALMNAADKLVQGKGKFEELMVCAQEIAASTAQLVVASKVKADRHSKCLASVSSASKNVSTATGNVVASTKAAAQIAEDKNLMDFTKLSLHQTKKLEMEAQIRVMELESALTQERRRLGELRKQHYQLAGESEEELEDEAAGTESSHASAS